MKKMILLLSFLLMMISACSLSSDKRSVRSIEEQYLPTRSSVLEKLGNGWIYFELDSVVYLYRKETDMGGFSYEAIASVPEPIASQLKEHLRRSTNGNL